MIVLETDRPVTIPTAHGQTWQGHDSCSGLTQLVKSWKSLACLQLCSGPPVGRWWKPCSYRLAAQWRRSCCQWAPQCSAGVRWVVGHLRQRSAARPWEGRVMIHSMPNTHSAGSNGCYRSDRFSWHLQRMSHREGHVKAPVILPWHWFIGRSGLTLLLRFVGIMVVYGTRNAFLCQSFQSLMDEFGLDSAR